MARIKLVQSSTAAVTLVSGNLQDELHCLLSAITYVLQPRFPMGQATEASSCALHGAKVLSARL